MDASRCVSFDNIVVFLYAVVCAFFFFQAEDGIRDLVRSRGLGDVYKRQDEGRAIALLGCTMAAAKCEHAWSPTRTEVADQRLSLIHI